MKTFRLTLLAAALGIAFPVSAEIPLKDYQGWGLREIRKDSEAGKIVKNYLVGVGRGVIWSEAAFTARGDEPRICAPSKLNFDDHIILGILDEQISRGSPLGRKYGPEVSVELIMMHGFMQRFPCEAASGPKQQPKDSRKPSKDSETL
jgi:hypothetical protein